MKKDEARIVPEVHFSFNDHPFRKPSFVLYFCGCPHKCKGCHSQELQNPYSDLCETITVSKLKEVLKYYFDNYNGKINSIVLLGGDPVVYTDFLIKLFSELKKEVKNIEVVLYTGYLFEELKEELKDLVDIIIDGKYREDLKTGKFPASSNQRVFVKENSEWKDKTYLFLG